MCNAQTKKQQQQINKISDIRSNYLQRPRRLSSCVAVVKSFDCINMWNLIITKLV